MFNNLNIFEKIKKNRPDLLLLGGLFLIFILLSSIFLFRQGSILIDCFTQNAYIPMEILKGKVLYKDIMVPYGPFSYQLNALLMLIFGQTVNTVYFIGVINSLIILLLIYLISRNITGRKLSFTVTFLVMAICVFHFWITNYIFPYSSAMTYSLTAFLASVFCSINYLKKSKPTYFLWAFVFIVISVLIKLDFIFFLFVLAAIALFIKPVSKKYLVLTVISSSVIPLLSWLILFMQGVTLFNLYEVFINIHKFAQSEPFRQFYANYTGMFFNPKLLSIDLAMFLNVFVNLLIATTIIYLYFLVLQKIFRLFKIELNNFILFLFTLPLYVGFLKSFYIHIFSNTTFSWMPITATLILITVLVFNFIDIKLFEIFKKNIRFEDIVNRLKLINLKQRIFILVCIAAIIAAMRCYFFVNLQIFGTFVLPLVLLVNIVFWVDYLPDFIEKYTGFNIEIWKKAWAISLILLGILFSINHIMIVKTNSYPLKTSKGTYYLRNQVGQVFQQTISYIQKHSNKNDSLLVMPRGLSINYFTGLSSNNKYYDFIPSTIEVYGEDKIVQDLNNEKPRFILITNENTGEWGAPFICKDYAFDVCRFIYKNYQYNGTMGDDFKIKIFEVKKDRHD